MYYYMDIRADGAGERLGKLLYIIFLFCLFFVSCVFFWEYAGRSWVEIFQEGGGGEVMWREI